MIRVGLGLHEKRLSILFCINWTYSCNVGEHHVMKNYRWRRGNVPGILDLPTGQGRVVKLLLSENESRLHIQREAGRPQSRPQSRSWRDEEAKTLHRLVQSLYWMVCPSKEIVAGFLSRPKSQIVCYLCHSYYSENTPLLMGNAASGADGSSQSLVCFAGVQ